MRKLFSPEVFSRQELRGRKVTVMGLGLFGGGRGLTEFLCNCGADVLVTDLRDAATLRPSLDSLEEYRIRWALGGHRREDFLRADMVFVNPAVSRSADILQECHRKGVLLETEMNLFFKLCRGRICGVTGSNGKTTTTSLTGGMFRQCDPRSLLGGNLGVSLLGQADRIGPETWVVLELSSFQLEDLGAIDRRPDISVVTNLSPNHLDRHGSYAQYLEAKRTILEGDDKGWAILNGGEAVIRDWAGRTRRRIAYFGRAGSVRPRAPGVWLVGDEVLAALDSSPRVLFGREDLALPGRFNLINAAGAAAAALCGGCSAGDVARAVREFRPLEHRLEFVRRLDGVEYFNDSIATTPESTLCAIEALGPDLILIAGGSDKGSSFSRLGHAMARRTRGVVLIGKTAPAILAAVRNARARIPVLRASSLEEAVGRTRGLARPGWRVALSPACASYDMFTHFAERGRRFKEIVLGL